MSVKSGQTVGVISQRVHLFPFRTQKLSSAEATILAWRRAGKIVHRQHRTAKLNISLAVSIYIPKADSSQPFGSYSSLAQSVEHMTVNHGVVGSSPTGGAILVQQFCTLTQKSLNFKDFCVFKGKKHALSPLHLLLTLLDLNLQLVCLCSKCGIDI